MNYVHLIQYMNDFLKSIESDLNIPWKYRKDFFSDEDDAPF